MIQIASEFEYLLFERETLFNVVFYHTKQPVAIDMTNLIELI